MPVGINAIFVHSVYTATNTDPPTYALLDTVHVWGCSDAKISLVGALKFLEEVGNDVSQKPLI